MFRSRIQYGSIVGTAASIDGTRGFGLLVARFVIEGATLLAERGRRKLASKKTLSNLVSCLRAIRTTVLADKGSSVMSKGTRHRLAKLPKRRTRIRFPTANWPRRFAAEWHGYEWKTKLLLTAAEGAAYRRTRCRVRTIDDGHVSHINPYVGFLVRECEMASFGLAETCNPELYKNFINWHLSQEVDGGYALLRHTAAVLATMRQYLVVMRQLSETVGNKKLWDVFYDIGRDVMSLGAERGHISSAADVSAWNPGDLHRLGVEGWDFEPPQDKMTSPYVHANTIFNRRCTSLFFYLACETPLRARNWLEMRWEKNLLRMPGGRWRVFFKGDELKIARRGYVTNVYEVVYSEEASRRIDLWRGVLRERFGPGFETLTSCRPTTRMTGGPVSS